MNKKKIFYRYNPQTLTYERVYPNFKSKVIIVLKHLFSGILVGGGLLLAFFYFFGSPQENALKHENNILRTQNKFLSNRIDDAIAVLNSIQERDDNMYRAIYQADPIAPSIRSSGIKSNANYKELQKISNPDLIVLGEKKMDFLEKQLYVQSNSLDEIHQMILNQKDRIHKTPSIQPIANKDLKHMASGYGMRIDPIYGTAKMHTGMDFSAPIGTPVYATADGVVKSTERNYGGYGNCINIDHGYNMTTKYAHLSKFRVLPGQHVKRGDIIGEVGTSGKSTGPHLHYEVRVKDIPQNPAYYYHGDLTPEEYALMLEMASERGQVMD